MTPSEASPAHARKVLRTIGVLLSSEYLVALIDEPIEGAAVSYQLPGAWPRDQERLLALVGDFLTHVHREAFPQGRQLSAEQARDAALSVLEYVADERGRVGYYELLLNVTGASTEDLPLVLWRAAEWIKTQKHNEHRRFVLIRYVAWARWGLKLAMARELLRLIKACHPSDELDLPAEFWVASLEELVALALSLDLLSLLDETVSAASETGSGHEPPV